jgi:hypothetical protein
VLNQAEELKKEKKSQKSHFTWRMGRGQDRSKSKKLKILIHIAACQLVFLMFAELKNHLKDYP